MKAVTERLQRLRFDRDRMSQREVAHKAGMTLQRYWEIENGYRQLTDADTRVIAKVLRVKPADVDPSFDQSPVAP